MQRCHRTGIGAYVMLIIAHNDHIIHNLALLRTVIMTGKIFRNRIIYRQYQIIGVTLDRKLS